MHSLEQRFRYVLAFLIGAVITAAVLRHVLHVYGGIPSQEMRLDALMTIPAVALAILFFPRKR
jgi:branched-subunit amino acid transport protein